MTDATSTSPRSRFGLAGWSLAASIRLASLRLRRGKKILISGIAAGVFLLFPLAIVWLEETNPESLHVSFEEFRLSILSGALDWCIFRGLIYFLPVLFASRLIGEELDGRTLHFGLMRPSGRLANFLGQWLVATFATAILITIATALLHLGCLATDPSLLVDELPDTLQLLGGAILASTDLCAIAFVWGTLLPRSAVVVTSFHFALIEFFGGLFPLTRYASFNAYARTVAGLEPTGFNIENLSVDLVPALIVATSAAVLLPALGLTIAHQREYRYGQS